MCSFVCLCVSADGFFMERGKFRPLKHVGVGACAAARKPAVPTRTDICYDVVDREIVAKIC